MSLSLGAIASAASGALKLFKNPKVLIGLVVVAALCGMGWYALHQAQQAGALEEKLAQAERRAENNAAEAERLEAEIVRRDLLAAKHREQMDALEERFTSTRRRLQQAGEASTGRYAGCRDARLPGDLLDGLRDGARDANGSD